MVRLRDFFSLSGQGQQALGRHTAKYAMTPGIWLAGVVPPSCFGAAWALREQPYPPAVLIALGALPIVVTCFVFVWFALVDPDRLGTEDFRLRQRGLEITQSKGGRFEVEPVNLVNIVNPFPSPKEIEAPERQELLEPEKPKKDSGKANDKTGGGAGNA
jgi:hypothetical protein